MMIFYFIHRDPAARVLFARVSGLAFDHSGHGSGISCSDGGIVSQEVLDLGKLVFGQADQGAVLNHSLGGGGTGNGDDGAEFDDVAVLIGKGPPTQTGDPGNGDLGAGDALSVGQLGDLVGDAVVVLEGIVLELGQVLAEVGVWDFGVAADRGVGQGAAGEGAVGDDGDAQAATGFGDAVFEDVGGPQGQLDLDGGDGVDLVGALDGAGLDFGQADATDLALAHQFGQSFHGLLKGHGGVDAGALKQINGLFAVEHAQAFLDAAAHVLGRSVGLQGARFGASFDAEDHLVGVLWVLGEVFVEQMARVAVRGPVEFAAIPEVESLRHGRVHGFEAGSCWLWWEPPGQAHQTKANGGNLLAEEFDRLGGHGSAVLGRVLGICWW